MPRSLRWSKEFHSGLLRSSAPFAHITFQAGTNNVLPSGFATAAARQHMVQAEMVRAVLPSTVLTAIFVPQENVSTVELHFAFWNTVIVVQSDDSRYLDLKIDGPNPFITHVVFV